MSPFFDRIRLPELTDLRTSMYRIASCITFYCVAVSVARAEPPTYKTLEDHLNKLEAVRERWRSIAQHIFEGHADRAKEVYASTFPYAGENVWATKDKRLKHLLGQSDWRKGSDHGRLRWAGEFIELEHPDFALVVYNDVQARAGSLAFSDACNRAYCLAESGQYQEAESQIKELLAEPRLASDWKQILQQRTDAIDLIETTNPLSVNSYHKYVQSMGRKQHISPILRVATLCAFDKSPNDQRELADMLLEAGDFEGGKAQLWQIASNSDYPNKNRSEALVALADRESADQQPQLALLHWTAVVESFKGEAAWADAALSCAKALKKTGKAKEAIGYYQQVLTAAEAELKNQRFDPLNHVSRAQWDIGECLLVSGNYQGALNAFQTAQTRGHFAGCGNAIAEQQSRYAFYQGLCYEYLKKYDLAIQQYAKACFGDTMLYVNLKAHIRLADLYLDAGQRSDLETILKHADNSFAAQLRREVPRATTQPVRAEWSPSRIIRRVLELRDMRQREEWPELIEVLTSTKAGVSPEDSWAKGGAYQQFEAAQCLSGSPTATVPLLLQTAEQKEMSSSNRWIYYALGVSGTSEALRYLEDRLHVEKNVHWIKPIVYALSRTAEGRSIIEQIENSAQGNLLSAIKYYKSGSFDDPTGVQFPPFPKGRLPKDYEEVKKPQQPPVRQSPFGPSTRAALPGV